MQGCQMHRVKDIVAVVPENMSKRVLDRLRCISCNNSIFLGLNCGRPIAWLLSFRRYETRNHITSPSNLANFGQRLPVEATGPYEQNDVELQTMGLDC